MGATFITTALENGAQLEDVQKGTRYRDPSTTKLYDRRGYHPEKTASFFCDLLRDSKIQFPVRQSEENLSLTVNYLTVLYRFLNDAEWVDRGVHLANAG
jgi:hypothetical protein